jgi:diguanylate cyclase (GGDEF)-like protein/PAS domain S-box-containing protein
MSRVHAAAKRSPHDSAPLPGASLSRRLHRAKAELTAARAALIRRDSLHRSIIDSSRMNVAVLDEAGTIVDVNEGWHAFAKANGFAGPEHGLGSSFLGVCADAEANPRDAVDASSVSDAQRAVEDVLAGRRDSATLSEACHSPTQQRWFELSVAPTAVGDHRGAILRYLDITNRVIAERDLHRQGELLEAIGADLPIIIFQRFRRKGTWEYVYASDSVSRLFGCSADELDGYPGDRMLECVHEEDRERVARAYGESKARGGGLWRSEFRIVDGAGATRWMDAVVRIRAASGPSEAESLWVLHDVSEQKLASLRVRQAYERDDLTGLLSRAYFETLVDAALARHVKGEATYALIILDIDSFQEINEVYGRTVGDKLLTQVASALQARVRTGDVVARFEADKFAMLCETRVPGAALLVAERLVSALYRTYEMDGHRMTVTLSAGVAEPHERDVRTTVNDLLQEAESAVERARDAGGNRCLTYSAEMTRESSARVALRDGLREALERGDQFELHYQPQVDISSGRIVACEALLRWRHPADGLQPPGDFIPLAEQSGLIVPIGRWVMVEACRQFMAWREAGLPEVPISVNVSMVQFARSSVLELISHALQTTGAPPGAIDIEITETVLADCSDSFVEQLEAIRGLGVGIHLDDFGVGFSSLGYLRRLPLSFLKIDQSFVRGALTNAKDAAIVRSVVDLASRLGLGTIAEGIETAEQLTFAREAGCDAMQGYYVSPALPAAAFSRFLVDEAAPVATKILAHV